MKKIITILLLGCLCLNLTGYHIVFQFRKAACKLAMKRMLRRQAGNKDEVVFSFALHTHGGPGTPEWEDENEFKLDGKMYDVIEKKIIDGRLVVRCISDEKESELIKKYQEILEKSSNNPAKKRSVNLLKLISAPFILPASLLPGNFVTILHREFSILRCSMPTACPDVITPPPRFL